MTTSKKYAYQPTTNKGVSVYVIDSGVYVNHTDFGGRAKWGTTITPGAPNNDDNGHGTHVAGIVAGKLYGVAKNAKVIAVKVLNTRGSGPTSDVIKGIDWSVAQHRRAAAKAKRRGKIFRGSVINLSLGTSKSVALDAATNSVNIAKLLASVL
jgi:cerevisin